MLVNGVESMDALASQIARACTAPFCMHLEGNLGAGKTTLVRGILRAFGHQGAVKSPTYTLVEPYQLDNLYIYHFDLYRLNEPEELEAMGIRDYLQEKALFFIEWPEKGHGVLSEPDLLIRFEHAGAARNLNFDPRTEKSKALVQAIDTQTV